MSTQNLLAPDQLEYAALTTGAAIQLRRDAGMLVLTDSDRVDFLQRMTTNNIQVLQPGRSCITILTSPTAKMLQVFTVLARGDDLLLLPARGETAALSRHLRGQIFFMDKVAVADRSAEYQRLRIMGAAGGQALTTAGLNVAGMVDGDWRNCDGVLVVAQDRYDIPGYELLVPLEAEATLLARLAQAGAVQLAADAAYTARRIELGCPAPGAELTGEYSPLEAGMAWTCAENKGCYTGQEIIARQLTYDKITRTLVGLRGEDPIQAGAAVTVDGQLAGVVTSAAFSSVFNAPIALAILKRSQQTPGTAVTINGRRAVITDLPILA